MSTRNPYKSPPPSSKAAPKKKHVIGGSGVNAAASPSPTAAGPAHSPALAPGSTPHTAKGPANTGVSLQQLGALLFNPSAGRPLLPSDLTREEVLGVRGLLLSSSCPLLSPSAKSQLTDEQVKGLIIAAGNHTAYASLFLHYLSHLSSTHFNALPQVLHQLAILRAESQDYKLDIYLFFKARAKAMAIAQGQKDAGRDLAANIAGQMSPKEVEEIFVAGGGFTTLTILHQLEAKGKLPLAAKDVMDAIAPHVQGVLQSLPRWKTTLMRFLTSTNILDFSLDEPHYGGPAGTLTSAAGLLVSHHPSAPATSSPLLDFTVSTDTVRHLLYMGADDTQLLFLMGRIHTNLKSVRIKEERQLHKLLKKEWNDFLKEIQAIKEWMKSGDNKLFTEGGDQQPQQANDPESERGAHPTPAVVHVSPSEIDGVRLQKLYMDSGLGALTLSILKSFNAKSKKFTSLDALTAALRSACDSIESMSALQTYLNAPNCALWSTPSPPRMPVTQDMIEALLPLCPEGTSVHLLLKECKRFERVARAHRARQAQQNSMDPTPAHAASEQEVEEDDHTIPAYFDDWAQLCRTLMSTLTKSLAQLQLDRENLSLTLHSVQLLLSTPHNVNNRAYSTHDLDTMLSVAYDSEHRHAIAVREGTSDPLPTRFTVPDLLSLLRRWHVEKRRFINLKALRRAILAEIGAAPTVASLLHPGASPADEAAAAAASTSHLLPSLTPSDPITPTQEKSLLNEFMQHPNRRLLMPAAGPDSGLIYQPTDQELEIMLAEKNTFSLGQAANAAAAQQQQQGKQKVFPLTNIHLFLSALESIERGLTQPYLSLSELIHAIRSHYQQLVSQMSETLRYLKSSRYLLQDPQMASTWTLQNEMVGLYAEAGTDLHTLSMLRRLERERYQYAPYADLTELIKGLRQAKVEEDRRLHVRRRGAKIHISDSDRQRVLQALKQASQGLSSGGDNNKINGTGAEQNQEPPVAIPPLLPPAFLEEEGAKEQVDMLLQEYPLYTLLQHIASITHHLNKKAHAKAQAQAQEEEGKTQEAANKPMGSPTLAGRTVAGSPTLAGRSIVASPKPGLPKTASVAPKDATSPTAAAPLKPLCPTWHALHLTLHESVLEFNRVRSEVLKLLSSPSCGLLSLSKVPVAITFDAVDRLVRACGLLQSELLAVLNKLNKRKVKLRGLPELAARVKSYHMERRKAEQQAARYALLRTEVLAYLQSDTCHLFLDAASRVRVLQELDDPSNFASLMLTSGGTLKSCLQLIHSLESDEQAFDSLESILGGMRAFKAKELLTKRFLPWINNPNVCTLFDKPGARIREVTMDDPVLSQLLNVQISEEAIRKHKLHVIRRADKKTVKKSSKDLDEWDDSLKEETEKVEMVLEFVLRLNARGDQRFDSFDELVNYVQQELEDEEINNEDPEDQSPVKASSSNPQKQRGYESDEDVDPRELRRQATLSQMPAASPKQGPLASPLRQGSTMFPFTPSPAHKGRGLRPGAGLSPHSTVAEDDDESAEEADDIEESPEEKAKELERLKIRSSEKLKAEIQELQRHGWILREDDEWLAIDREKIEEVPMTEELLNHRRLAIFAALSYPACLLFSNRVEPMSLSDIDLDAVLSSAGGGEKGMRIAISLIKLLDRKHAKFLWFDQVTLEIARRWQRRKAWEYLTVDPVGKKMLEKNTGSVPLLVLKVLVAINPSHGVDPALSATDMLQIAHEVHPHPFSSHSELLYTIKSIVRHERRETLRSALVQQFASLFPFELDYDEDLDDIKMDLLLTSVDHSLYHALKYMELIQAEGGRDFEEVLDLVPLLMSLHAREKSGVPDVFSSELEIDENPEDEEEDDEMWASEEACMLRRQKVFQALSFPKCTLFTAKSEPLTLTDVDLDDVVKAGNDRLSYTLKTLVSMDKTDKMKFHSFYAAVLELARRCQLQGAISFLLGHECRKFLHRSIKLSKNPEDPELKAMVTRLLTEGMSGADPYLSLVTCLKALNQTPKVLAQCPPSGGYRSIDALVGALKSLAHEQRVWMIKHYFAQSTIQVHVPSKKDPKKKRKAPPISDKQIAELLHTCANSIYFVLRHLQTVEESGNAAAAATPKKRAPAYGSYESIIAEVSALHQAVLRSDPSLQSQYTPSGEVQSIDQPNEAKQQELQEAAEKGSDANAEDILAGVAIHVDKIKKGAALLLEAERAEEEEEKMRAGKTADGQEEKTPLSPVSPPSSVLSADQRFLSDARFQLLQALSFPKSQLFSKCIRPVAIRDKDLDAVFQATCTPAAEEAAEKAKTNKRASNPPPAGLPSATSGWLPTPTHLSESLRIVKHFDSSRFTFHTFAHFMREYRAFVLQERRAKLLQLLSYPQCRLFSQCPQTVKCDDRELDKLLVVPAPAASLPPAYPPNSFLPLSYLAAAIQQLDTMETRVNSFAELTPLVKEQFTL